jgi:hypothetical protein
MKLNGYNEVKFSALVTDDSDAKQIIKNLEEVVFASCTNNYGNKSMTKKFSMDGMTYSNKEVEARKAALTFAASKAGIKELTEKKHLVMAFDNPMFVSILNSIVSESLLGVVTNTGASQLMALCNVDDVEIGDSKTYEIETKGLPITQRASYMNNVAFLDGYVTSSITVTPKVYTTGSSIDYIRILANGYDWGKELARVAMSLLYAQYKLVSGLLFDTANVTGTPLYQATFAADKYVGMISDLQALNRAGVKAYGTLPAFQKQGSLATTNYGFETQDEIVRNGMLGRAYGIDNIVIDQATDLSAPFIDANHDSLLLIPNNRILLLSDVGDRPVKLVRENFIRVLTKEANDGSLYRQTFSYSMSFDAGLITQSHFALQSV